MKYLKTAATTYLVLCASSHVAEAVCQQTFNPELPWFVGTGITGMAIGFVIVTVFKSHWNS